MVYDFLKSGHERNTPLVIIGFGGPAQYLNKHEIDDFVESELSSLSRKILVFPLITKRLLCLVDEDSDTCSNRLSSRVEGISSESQAKCILKEVNKLEIESFEIIAYSYSANIAMEILKITSAVKSIFFDSPWVFNGFNQNDISLHRAEIMTDFFSSVDVEKFIQESTSRFSSTARLSEAEAFNLLVLSTLDEDPQELPRVFDSFTNKNISSIDVKTEGYRYEYLFMYMVCNENKAFIEGLHPEGWNVLNSDFRKLVDACPKFYVKESEANSFQSDITLKSDVPITIRFGKYDHRPIQLVAVSLLEKFNISRLIKDDGTHISNDQARLIEDHHYWVKSLSEI